MSKFCVYENGVGIKSGDKLLFSVDKLEYQFGQSGCGYFVDQLNEAADSAGNQFCDYSEEWYCKEGNLFIIHTLDTTSVIIDGEDSEEDAKRLRDAFNYCYAVWRNSNA
jgi:hypothetical protein